MKIIFLNLASQRGASDIITNFSMISNPAGAQNFSCLGLSGGDNCLKITMLNMGWVFSIYETNN